METIATYVPRIGAEAAAELATPPEGATSVELRADLLPPGADLGVLVGASALPVLVTLRSAAEGGRGPDDPATRRAFFLAAARLPAALFDVEEARDLEWVGSILPAERVVVSAHLSTVPADLEERMRALLSHGTRLAKLVPTARSLNDVLEVVRLQLALDRGPRQQRRAILFAAGESGRATRMLGPLLAAPAAYVAWSDDRPAAPGQMSAAALLAIVGHLQGRPRRVFAVLGSSVGGSLSPRMHAGAFRALALPNLLMPLEVTEVAELDRLIAPLGDTALDALGLSCGGFAVTMPWKEEAARRCGLLAPRAERARAANTLLPRPGRVVGDLTDIDGLTRVLLEEGMDLPQTRALVLGTGATARAAVVALDLGGAEVAVAARDTGKAEALARELGITAVPAATADFDVVINATPAGADGASTPLLDALRLDAGAVAVDFPYAGAPTFLELLSERRGWRYVGGRDVLLYQGVSQFAAMNGMAPPVRAMAAALGLEETQA